MRLRVLLALVLLSQLSIPVLGANKIPIGTLLDRMIRRSTLAEPGGRPFYLKATITDRDDKSSQFNGTVEQWWVSPTKWRRVINLREFSQTRIVNGDKIYEENKGDYFPVTDEMLANEIVDPLPKSAVDLLNKLDIQITEPGTAEGQCMAEKYFNDEEGVKTRVLLSYDCKSGMLIYLWSPTCCYGVMTEYRKFHDKLVANATKDNPINIRVDTLRDLDLPDEKLFIVSDPTPPAAQIITKRIGEKEARSYISDKPEIQWPSAATKPIADNIKVSIVIGRDGRVKEAKTYSQLDTAMKDAVIEGVKRWTFRPQTVEGVPAQLKTEITIPISRELKAALGSPDIRGLFERVRSVGDLRGDGEPAFHLNASFHSEDGTAKGIYEETWLSPKKWRREVTLNNKSVIEVRTEEAFYRTFPGLYAPRVADDIIEFLSFSLPGNDGSDIREGDWTASNETIGGIPVVRLTDGYISPQGEPSATATQFLVGETTGVIRGRYHYSMITVFEDLQPFGKKIVARKLTSLGGDVKKLEITIDTLEPATNVGDAVFALPGVKPILTFPNEDHRFKQPRSVYTVNPQNGWHGDVTCQLHIDQRGHVRNVNVKGTTDQSIISYVRALLAQWEYEPATSDGILSESLVDVHLKYK